jgi:hypothetical protein
MNLKRFVMVRAVLTSKILIGMIMLLALFFVFIAPNGSTIKLASYKLMLGIAGAVIGHIVVKSLYPYMSLSKLLEEDKKNETADSLKFLGACILRGCVMGALIIGILLGV